MSFGFLVKGVVRSAFAALVVVATLAPTVGHAEAKRIKVKASEGSSSQTTQSAGQTVEVSPPATSGTTTPPNNPASSPRRQGKASSPHVDIEVPGCPAGMLCTVCLAGCVSAPGSILHAQPRSQIRNN